MKGDVRYYAFDSLRAAMMLLGIVLHVATSYTITIPRSGWGYKDPNTSIYADLLVFGIHAFRMPVFFVMAGFFAALLRERYGVPGMLKNRAIRILVPLLVFWVILLPTTITGEWFANARAVGQSGWEAIRTMAAANPIWMNTTMHLWFLYLLIIFYTVATALGWLARSMPAIWRERGSRGFRRMMAWRGRALILAPPIALAIFLQGGFLRIPSTFTPPVLGVVTYLMFFAFGWALHVHRDLLSGLTRNAWLQSLLGMLLFVVVVILSSRAPQVPTPAGIAIASILWSVIAWLMVLGLSGLALRYLERPIRNVRYLTDSAYWCYLIHFPVAFWVSGLFAPYDLPAAVKIALVLLVVIPLVLASYHFLVRSTVIGVLLNGRRYPAVHSGTFRDRFRTG